MIKIIVLILSLGLSLLTTLTNNNLSTVQIVFLTIGLFLAYIVGFIVLFFFFAFMFSFYVNEKKKPTKYCRAQRSIYNVFVRICLSLFGVKLTKKGLDKVPKGAVVIMSNHVSNVDPLIMNIVHRDKDLIFASKKSLFKVPCFGKMIHKIGYLKFDRIDSMKDMGEMKRGVKWVKDGISLCLYPEGTRNKSDDYLLEFKAPAMKFATLTNSPLVVSAIYGTKEVNDKLLLKRHKVDYEVLDVIYPEDYKNMSNDELTKVVYEKIEKWIKEKSENV